MELIPAHPILPVKVKVLCTWACAYHGGAFSRGTTRPKALPTLGSWEPLLPADRKCFCQRKAQLSGLSQENRLQAGHIAGEQWGSWLMGAGDNDSRLVPSAAMVGLTPSQKMAPLLLRVHGFPMVPIVTQQFSRSWGCWLPNQACIWGTRGLPTPPVPFRVE